MNYKIAAVITVLVLSAISLFTSQRLYSPGGLNAKHAMIKDCAACHEPFRKIGGTTCTANPCHNAAYWANRKGLSLVHLETAGCSDCHTEHKGEKTAVTAFKPHEKLPETVYCRKCHRAGAAHAPIKKQDCNRCHTMKAWKPAKYDYCYGCHDHGRAKVETAHVKLGILNYSGEPNCVRCHATEREHEPRKEGKPNG